MPISHSVQYREDDDYYDSRPQPTLILPIRDPVIAGMSPGFSICKVPVPIEPRSSAQWHRTRPGEFPDQFVS